MHLGERVYVPPSIRITVDYVALHRHPRDWEDPHTWNPDRWVKVAGGGLVTRNERSFAGFGDAPKICVGKSFAETEYRAVMAALLEQHSVEIPPKNAHGKSTGVDARSKAAAQVQGSTNHGASFGLSDAATKFRWVERRHEDIESIGSGN